MEMSNERLRSRLKNYDWQELPDVSNDPEKIISKNQIIDAQKVIEEIYVDEKVEDYILNLLETSELNSTSVLVNGYGDDKNLKNLNFFKSQYLNDSIMFESKRLNSFFKDSLEKKNY